MATPQKKATPKFLTKKGTNKTASKAVSPYEIPGAPPLTSMELEDAERWLEDGLTPQDIRERIARKRHMDHLYESICHMTIQELKEKILSRELLASHVLLVSGEGDLGALLYKTLECKFANISGIVCNYPEFQEADRLHLWVALDSLLPGPNLLLKLRQKASTYQGFSSQSHPSAGELETLEASMWSTLEKGLVETLTNMEYFPLQREVAVVQELHVEYFENIAKDLISITKEYFFKTQSGKSVQPPVTVAAAVIPVSQRNDADLVQSFVDGPRDEAVIAELEKRSKGMGFLAYRSGGLADFKKELSLDLLKTARKGERTPLYIEGCTVYTVAQLDIKNRIRHECPLCPGVALVRHTCPVCQHDFSGLGKNAQISIRVGRMAHLEWAKNVNMGKAEVTAILAQELVVPTSELYSRSLVKSGYEQLYNHLLATGSLPTLILVDSPVFVESSSTLKTVDAFHRNLGGK